MDTCLTCKHPTSEHLNDADAFCILCDCEGLHLDVGDCTDECHKEHKWIHNPNLDGVGCGWCGSWAQINDERLCRECYEDEEHEPT